MAVAVTVEPLERGMRTGHRQGDQIPQQFRHSATISPFVRSQYGFVTVPGIPSSGSEVTKMPTRDQVSVAADRVAEHADPVSQSSVIAELRTEWAREVLGAHREVGKEAYVPLSSWQARRFSPFDLASGPAPIRWSVVRPICGRSAPVPVRITLVARCWRSIAIPFQTKMIVQDVSLRQSTLRQRNQTLTLAFQIKRT